MKFKNLNKGFTLLEIVIALAIMVLMMGVVVPIYFGAISLYQNFETSQKLDKLAEATKIAYKKYAMIVDTVNTSNEAVSFDQSGNYILGNENNGSNFTSGSITISPTPAYTVGSPNTLMTGFNALASVGDSSPISLATDGYGRPFMVYVSPLLVGQYKGYNVYYHDIAYVSNMGGTVKAGVPNVSNDSMVCSFNAQGDSSCNLNLTKGDKGVLVSGFNIEAKLLSSTLSRMNSIAKAYSNYFTISYLSNSSRNLDYDYFFFGNPNNNAYDSGATGGPSSSEGGNYSFPGNSLNSNNQIDSYGWGVSNAFDMNDADIYNYIGISQINSYSAWGYQIGIANIQGTINATNLGNQSNNIRSTGNNGAEPPYSAAILAWAPNGVLLSQNIVGNY